MMEYLLNLGTLFCIYAILALSLNMVTGLMGIVLLTHAVFYGIGAYAVAILMTVHGLSFWISMLSAILLNGITAFFISKINYKIKSNYFNVLLLYLFVIAFFVFVNFNAVRGNFIGTDYVGKPEIQALHFYSAGSFFAIVFAFTLLFYGLFILIGRSSFGRVLKGVREDEELVGFLGYKTKQYKSVVYVYSAIMAGVAGSFFESYIAFTYPTCFQLCEGLFLLTFITLNVFSSIRGRIASAAILLMIPESLRFLGLPYETAAQLQQLIYCSLLILIMVFRPKSLFGKYRV